MTKGKTSLAESSIIRDKGLTLRQLGYAGEVIEHYTWDRAKYVSLARLVKALHRSEVFEATADASAEMLQMTQFVLTTPCALHDASKANHWALYLVFGDLSVMRDVFIAVESIRNSMATRFL